MSKPLVPVLLLAALGAASLAQDELGNVTSSGEEMKAWNASKSYRDDFYVIVKKDGTSLRAAEPYELKGDQAMFHILVNFRKGPLTFLPIDEIDVDATIKANLEPVSAPAPETKTPSRPSPGNPVYGTKAISSILETEEGRAQRERIKQRREEARQAEIEAWEARQAAKNAPPPAPDERKAQIDPESMALAKEGKVRKGMPTQAVIMAWGRPDQKTAEILYGQERERWVYLTRGKPPMEVTVVDGAVVQIRRENRLLYTASLQ